MEIKIDEGQDLPSVGEWWVNANGKRMYIAGITADGKFILEFPSGGVHIDHGNWAGCYRLVGCKDWYWIEQPVFCGDGYRFIDVKEDSPKSGDEMWNSCKQEWQKRSNYKTPFDLSRTTYRRKEEKPSPTVEPELPINIIVRKPVRLWVSDRITYESGDWPVRCGNEPPSGLGSWAEIFPSPDGFFVTKQS